MNQLLFLLFAFCIQVVHSQVVESKRLGLTINTGLNKESADHFSDFLEKDISEVHLVLLKPDCFIRTYTDSLSIEKSDTLCTLSTCILNNPTRVDVERFGANKLLLRKDFGTLLSIIYEKGTNELSVSASCYEPRHALVFYNAKGTIIGYIEICLACSSVRTFGATPPPGNLTEKDYKDIKGIIRQYFAVE